ncbi:MAG: hypothetical protein AAGJ10_19440 [Bacteroidota bacterium]
MLLRTLAVMTASLTLFASSTYAQDNVRPNALEADTWAVVFQVGQPISLRSFQGTIAVKHHTASDRAWRVGLGGSGNQSLNSQGGGVNITAQADYLIYPMPPREVNMYWGVGPSIGFTRNAQKQNAFEDIETQFRIGVGGLLGAEWFATEHISLFGEYGTSLTIRLQRETITTFDPQPSEVENTTTNLTFGTGATLGLNLYF